MCVPNLAPIGPQTATCIRLEGYTHTHTHTHTLSYIDIDCVHATSVNMFKNKIDKYLAKAGYI